MVQLVGESPPGDAPLEAAPIELLAPVVGLLVLLALTALALGVLHRVVRAAVRDGVREGLRDAARAGDPPPPR